MTEKKNAKRRGRQKVDSANDVTAQLRKMIKKLPKPVPYTKLDCVGGTSCKIGLPQSIDRGH